MIKRKLSKKPSKPPRQRKPMSRGTKGMSRKRMSQRRKPKHKAESKWTNLLGDRRSIIEQLYRLTSWIVIASGKGCVTCPMRAKNLLQCGHLFERRILATAFDIPQLVAAPNNNIQCARCNARHESHPHKYRQWFIKKYGQKAYDALKQRYTRDEYIDTVKLVEMRDRYEQIWQTIQQTQLNRTTG